jgi:mono/diheme cytochrome c family protein
MKPAGALLVAAALTLVAVPALARQASASNGERLARRYCSGCHAVRDGASPLPDAPPFASLHDRYPPGGLATVLEEGMLAPRRPPEEGAPRSHPRMPMTQLDDDQRADLEAYLRGLDPRRPAPPRPRL